MISALVWRQGEELFASVLGDTHPATTTESQGTGLADLGAVDVAAVDEGCDLVDLGQREAKYDGRFRSVVSSFRVVPVPWPRGCTLRFWLASSG